MPIKNDLLPDKRGKSHPASNVTALGAKVCNNNNNTGAIPNTKECSECLSNSFRMLEGRHF